MNLFLCNNKIYLQSFLVSCESLTTRHFVDGSVYRLNHLKYFDSSRLHVQACYYVSCRNPGDNWKRERNFLTHPRKSNASDGIAEHVSQDGRERVPGREVGVEARMLPVGDSWHDLAVHILHDLVPFLRLLGRLLGQQLPEVSWFNVRRDPLRTDVLQVITDVIDHLFAATSELLDVHLAAHQAL